MREEYLYPKVMFNVNAGGYCGVVMPTHVMKKLEKMMTLYQKQVQSLLNEYKDELFPYNWTCENIKNEAGNIVKQVVVHYANPKDISDWDNVDHRIRLFKPTQPTKIDLYLCDRDKASEIAFELLEEEV